MSLRGPRLDDATVDPSYVEIATVLDSLPSGLPVSDVISVPDAAKLLEVSQQRIRQLIQNGRLKSHKIGPVHVLLRDDILALKHARKPGVESD